MDESGLLEWKTGRFLARMGLGSYLKKLVKLEPGRVRRVAPESATFPNSKKIADSAIQRVYTAHRSLLHLL